MQSLSALTGPLVPRSALLRSFLAAQGSLASLRSGQLSRVLLGASLLFLIASQARGQGTLVEETWDAAYLEGAKAGYFHTTVRELERDGKKIYRTTLKMHLTVRRYNSVVPLRIETGTEETKTGKVVGLFLTQYLDRGKIEQTGEVKGDKLILRTKGVSDEKVVPWDKRVLGLYRQQKIFAELKVKPGTRFRFYNFEMPVLSSVPVVVTVHEPEVVDLLDVRKEDGKVTAQRKKASLMRVEAKSGKIKVGKSSIQLPTLLSWLNDKRQVVRSEFRFAGLGRITLYRTTQVVAQQQGVAPALLPDLGLTTLVPVRKVIKDANQAKEIVYRIRIKGDDDPTTTFTQDARQKMGKVSKDGWFDLMVGNAKGTTSKQPKPDFVKPNYFLDTSDILQTRARRIVGDEKDPWKKAQLIEKWVHDNMKPSSAVGFARASQVCVDLKGDCRQHAVLSAALCRAVKVPARTAVGLVYVPNLEGKPVLGFHMWTEVWADGQWRGLDATRGLGKIGPGHLKITEASWNGVYTLAPLLPVSRVLGKIQIEIADVKR